MARAKIVITLTVFDDNRVGLDIAPTELGAGWQDYTNAALALFSNFVYDTLMQYPDLAMKDVVDGLVEQAICDVDYRLSGQSNTQRILVDSQETLDSFLRERGLEK